MVVARTLAQDLAWLEEHTRRTDPDGSAPIRLRLAAGLARNLLAPLLAGSRPPPLHIVVVGGAGVGKSTVTNFLLGTVAAEANPQAGFTRHPVAYAAEPPAQSDWLGALRLLPQPQPSNLDEDVYQIRIRPNDLGTRAVVWDCPDMTTWRSSGYVPRLAEVVGLADLIIYVASDERYNDATPTDFLRLILQAGKPVITCIVKANAAEAPQLVDHFRREIVARIPECTRVSACVAIPYLPAEVLADPAGRGASHRQNLLQPVRWWLERGEQTRWDVARGAVDFLEKSQESWLQAPRHELEVLTRWEELIKREAAVFADRYGKEHLSGEQFPRFNEALVRLLELLELPGVGQYVTKALEVVRMPYRLLKGWWGKTAGTAAPRFPEEPVLKTALAAWLDALHKAAAAQEDNHPLWEYVKSGLRGPLPAALQQQFELGLKEFQQKQQEEVAATARSLYEALEKNPVALNGLRGVKFSLDVTAIGAALLLGGLSPWNLVFVPLAASVTQALVEQLGAQYVDAARERARDRQQRLFQATLADPLAELLRQWPLHESTRLQQLRSILERVPRSIAEVAAAVRQLAQPAERPAHA